MATDPNFVLLRQQTDYPGAIGTTGIGTTGVINGGRVGPGHGGVIPFEFDPVPLCGHGGVTFGFESDPAPLCGHGGVTPGPDPGAVPFGGTGGAGFGGGSGALTSGVTFGGLTSGVTSGALTSGVTFGGLTSGVGFGAIASGVVYGGGGGNGVPAVRGVGIGVGRADVGGLLPGVGGSGPWLGAGSISTTGATAVSRCANHTIVTPRQTRGTPASSATRVRRLRASLGRPAGLIVPELTEVSFTPSSVLPRSHSGAGINTAAPPSSATGFTRRRCSSAHAGHDSMWRATRFRIRTVSCPSQPCRISPNSGHVFRSVRAPRATQRTQAALDSLAQPEHHGVGVCHGHAESFGEFGSVQPMPIGQLQQFAVTIGEPAGGVGNQPGQLALPGRDIGTPFGRCGVGHSVGGLFAVAMPKAAHRMVSRDGVQPRPKFVGLAQTAQLCRGDTEGVLHAVGGAVPVSDHPDAIVVEPVAVAVVDLDECLPITLGSGARQLTVGDVGPQRQRLGHDDTPRGSPAVPES